MLPIDTWADMPTALHCAFDGPRLPARIIREQIAALQRAISLLPGAVFGNSDLCPVTHRFSEGIYTREMFIPAGVALVGHIHKYAHPSILLSGEILIITEQTGKLHLLAPQFFISPAGTKRAGFALTDTVWVTIHHNPDNCTDIDTLEAALLAPSFEDFAAWQAAQEEDHV